MNSACTCSPRRSRAGKPRAATEAGRCQTASSARKGILSGWAAAQNSSTSSLLLAVSATDATLSPVTGARPGGHRTLLQLAVDEEVDALVEERDATGDLGGIAQRLAVAPRDVGRARGAEVRRLALVCAAGDEVSRFEQLGAHVIEREVVADGQRRLEQEMRRRALGEHGAVDLHPHGPGAVDDVDAVERVARVGEVALVLLEPLVEA